MLYPLIGSLTTSVFEQSLVLPGRAFVGLDNFRHVLDDEFWPVLQNTLVFTGRRQRSRRSSSGSRWRWRSTPRCEGRAVLRGAFLFPWVIPGVVVSFVWLWIFNANYGLLNGILVRLGTHRRSGELARRARHRDDGDRRRQDLGQLPLDHGDAAGRVCRPFPTVLHEAAAIDGAGTLRRFWHVTLPHLRGIIGIVVLLELIWNFQHFDTIYVLTGGGPAGADHHVRGGRLRHRVQGRSTSGRPARSARCGCVLLLVLTSSTCGRRTG